MTSTLDRSNNPPTKNEAYTFYFVLVSQADTDIFQANPTIASGDFKTHGDGGTPANTSNTPSVIASGKVVSLTLTAAEMNYNTVYVIASDAAGDEWQDAMWVIDTTTETTVGANDAPTAASVADAVWDELKADHTTPDSFGDYLDDEISNISVSGATVYLAVSATEAASVSSGSVAITTYHTLSQSVSSTTTSDLDSATKLWFAIKTARTDADAASIIFIEATAGLTVVDGDTYATTGNGSLTVTGSSGDWDIAIKIEEAATALLSAGTGLYAEVKALVSGDTVPVWDGACTITDGIVKAYS